MTRLVPEIRESGKSALQSVLLQRLIPLQAVYTLQYVSDAFCVGFEVCESFSFISRGICSFLGSRHTHIDD